MKTPNKFILKCCKENIGHFDQAGLNLSQWRHMSVNASQITCNLWVCWTACLTNNKTKHQGSTSLTVCEWNPSVTGGFSIQTISNARSVSLQDVGIFYPTDTERFREWMAHEAYAETRRRSYIKTTAISSFMAKLTEFAEKSEASYDNGIPTETEFVTVTRRKKYVMYGSSIGHAAGVNAEDTTVLVSSRGVKSLQLIWRSGTRRFHLRVPDLQMSRGDLTHCLVTPYGATKLITMTS